MGQCNLKPNKFFDNILINSVSFNPKTKIIDGISKIKSEIGIIYELLK